MPWIIFAATFTSFIHKYLFSCIWELERSFMLFICFSDLNIFFREVGGFKVAKLYICKNYTHIRSYKLHVTRFEKVPSLRVSSAQEHTKLRVTFEGFILRHGRSFVKWSLPNLVSHHHHFPSSLTHKNISHKKLQKL